MPTVTAGNGKVGEISYIRQDVRNSRKAIVIEACYTFFTVGNSAVVMRAYECPFGRAVVNYYSEIFINVILAYAEVCKQYMMLKAVVKP